MITSLRFASFGRGRHVLVSFLFFMGFLTVSNAQSSKNILDTLISITFNNQRLSDALEQMELQTHITFSYKSGLLRENRIINKHFVKEPMERILQQIIANDSISFQAIGRQIAFYVPRNTKFVTIEKVVLKPVEVPVLQNVYIRDTVRIQVTRIDTLTIFKTDTIFVPKEVFIPDKTGRYSFSAYLNQSSVNPHLKMRDNGIEPIYNDLLEAESNGSATRFGVMGKMHYKDFSLSSGLGISVFRNKANYDFTSILVDSAKVVNHRVTENFEIFKADSFSITIEDPDTTFWAYDYDTIRTFVVENEYKKDTIDFKHVGTNRYTYFTIPLYFGWEKALNDRSTLFLEAGVLVDFLISTKGKSLSDSPFKELVPLSSLPLSPVNASFSLGAGYAYDLKNKWQIYGKINYDFQVNSSYTKLYPIRKKPTSIGFTIGVWYK